jgi:bacillithiol biosynthesis cysteine-adding enzyme BshC
VPPSKALGYSDIYLDFVAGNDPPGRFYLAESLAAAAERLDRVNYDRPKLAGILRRQNKVYGSSGRTFDNIDRLAQPGAVCLFAGQQAGFLGGPMFTMIKAVAVVKAAEACTEQLGRPVIPMFWIAGDDHDFEEANHAWLLNRNTEPCRIAYATAPLSEDSVADIRLADAEELARANESLRACLGETDFTPALYELIERAYTPEDTLVTAFGKLVASLLEERGLVLFCPGDAEVKRHAAGFFKAILDRQEALQEAIGKANAEIAALGYHIQVEKKDTATHLFYNLDGRKPVMRNGEGYLVGEKVVSRSELEKCIDDHPERFSPDVMTRPVFQSYLFPTVSQKCGPAEIAYLAQINPIFALFDLPAPLHLARPSITVIETRFEKLMADLQITFEELTGDIEQVINRVLAASFPESLEQNFLTLKNDVESRFEQFLAESLKFDPALKSVGRQVYGKIDYNLKAFEAKVFSAHKKQSKQARDRIYRLANALQPNRGLQERCLSVCYFMSRYGPAFIDFLFEQIDSEETAHQLIYISQMKESG